VCALLTYEVAGKPEATWFLMLLHHVQVNNSFVKIRGFRAASLRRPITITPGDLVTNPPSLLEAGGWMASG